MSGSDLNRGAIARWQTSHLTGLYLITAICGLVDAACFLSLGAVFAEIMTGNLLFLCFTLGAGQPLAAGGKYLLALAAFSLGAIGGGHVVRGRWQQTRLGFAIEGILLLAALSAAALLHPAAGGTARDIVVSLLAVAMGLQNALIRRHGVPDLATNVMTLTLTALIAEWRAGGEGSERQRRRLSSVTIFLASAAVGAMLTTQLGPWAPLALAVALFGLALTGLMRDRS